MWYCCFIKMCCIWWYHGLETYKSCYISYLKSANPRKYKLKFLEVRYHYISNLLLDNSEKNIMKIIVLL